MYRQYTPIFLQLLKVSSVSELDIHFTKMNFSGQCSNQEEIFHTGFCFDDLLTFKVFNTGIPGTIF